MDIDKSDLFQQISTGCPDVFLTGREINTFPCDWKNRVGMTIYGNGTSFQAAGVMLLKIIWIPSNVPASCHLCVRLVNTQRTCVVSPLSPGALWSVR